MHWKKLGVAWRTELKKNLSCHTWGEWKSEKLWGFLPRRSVVHPLGQPLPLSGGSALSAPSLGDLVSLRAVPGPVGHCLVVSSGRAQPWQWVVPEEGVSCEPGRLLAKCLH